MTLPLLALVVSQTGVLDLTAQKELQVPVTMKMRAKRMPLALAEIGKTGGVKLSSGPEFENEPLIVVVDNVSLASLMDQTAKAAGGQWVKTGEEFRLLRPSALVEKFRLQERQWIRQTLRRASEVPLEEPLDLKIHTALLRLINPEFVEGLSPLDRVVFSDKPSAWQVPAGTVGRELLQLGVQKWRADKADWDSPKQEPATDEDEEHFPFEYSQFPPNALRVATFLDSPYSLCVDFPSSGVLSDPKDGPPITVKNFPSYVNFGTSFIPFHADESEEHTVILRDKGVPFKVSAPYDGFFNLMSVNDDSLPVPKAADPEFERMVMRPDEHDPLSFATSDYLFTLAEDQKSNLVAIPTDDLFDVSEDYWTSEANISFESFTERLNDSGPMRVAKDGTFLRVEPNWKVRGKWARLNRIALRTLLDSKQKFIAPPLNSYAEFARSVPDYALNIYDTYAQATGLVSWFSPSSDYFNLRFYDSLSIAQREALLGGQRLSFSQLSPPQRLVAQRMISHSSGSGNGDSLGNSPRSPAEMPAEISDNLEITDLFTHVSEHSITFSASSQKQTVIALADYNLYPEKLSPLYAALYAVLRHQMENDERPIENGILPNFDKYFLGQESNYDIEILFTPNLKRTIGLTDTQFSQRIYSYEELPADFRATAETVRDRIRNRRNRP